MENKETDLKSLSNSELDALIQHGINQQEVVKRHSEQYQHHMNVVAAAKAEKAGREAEGETAVDELAIAKQADKVKDVYTEANPLSNMGAKQNEITPDPKKKEVKEAAVAKTPKPTDPDYKELPADKINQGIPGIIPKAAETTPENKSK